MVLEVGDRLRRPVGDPIVKEADQIETERGLCADVLACASPQEVQSRDRHPSRCIAFADRGLQDDADQHARQRHHHWSKDRPSEHQAAGKHLSVACGKAEDRERHDCHPPGQHDRGDFVVRVAAITRP